MMERQRLNRGRRLRTGIVAIVLGVLLLPVLLWWSLAPQQVALAQQTFIVTKTDDTADGTCDADCSLREAIIAANANPGADVITLPAGIYTLTLTDTTNINGHEDYAALGDLDIWDDLTINGAGEGTTIIDGNDEHRIFHVLSGTVTINDVTLQNGRSFDQGGAIRNASTLVINRSTITGNVGSGAGAILNADYDYSTTTSDQPNGPTYNWNDISSTAISSTETFTYFDLGFDFVFYGETYDRVWVSDGYVSFESSSVDGRRRQVQMPIPETDEHTQRAIHAHYHPGSTPPLPVYWEVQGSAPNRVATIQYDRASDYQILLYEGSNKVRVQYKDAFSANDRGRSLSGTTGEVLSVGIIDSEKRRTGISFAHNQAILTDTFAIEYTPLATRGNLTLDNVTLTANQTSAKLDGAGLMNGGTALVRNSIVSHHSWIGMGSTTLGLAGRGGNGSGIANRGQLTVENSRIFENQAIKNGNGAGLSNHWGSVTISNTQVYSNSRIDNIDGSGAGLSNQNGTMIIVGSAITNNVTEDDNNSSGAGVFNLRGHLIITATDILSNSEAAGNSGAGIQSIMGIVEVYNSRIGYNQVGDDSSGGAIDAMKSRVIIDGSLIDNNLNPSTSADDINLMGGAIRVQQGQLDITNSQVTSNTNVSESGGAIAHISGDRRPIGYTMIDSNYTYGPAYNWVDISSTGTALSLGDDDYYTATLPFDFYFYDIVSDTVYVSSNGFLTFDTAGQDSTGLGCEDDADASPNLLIAGLGAHNDDLDPSLGGEIYVEVLGTAPNRRFVVQYDNVVVIDGVTALNGGVTFQVILFESTDPEENIIHIQYKDVDVLRTFPKPSFTVKLESGKLGDYQTYQATVYYECFDEDIPLENELVVEFKPAGRLYAVGNTFVNNIAGSYGQAIYTDGAFPLGYAELLNNIFDAVSDAFSTRGVEMTLAVTPTEYVQPGETITYTLAFTNVSHVIGVSALLSDVVPAGILTERLANVSVEGSIPLTATGAPTYTWQLPPLVPNESGIITITAEAVGRAEIVNSATITTSPWVWLPQSSGPVTVTYQGAANVAPVTVDDIYTTTVGISVTLDLVANDTDANDDDLFATLLTQPVNGVISNNQDGTFTYTPDAGFQGLEVLRYEVNDAVLSADTGIVTVVVNAPLLPGIALSEGWNIFGYPLQESLPVSTALSSIAGSYNLVLAYDPEATANPWTAYNPTWNPALNDLSTLEFGVGYWINAGSAVTVDLNLDLQASSANGLSLPPSTVWGSVMPKDDFVPVDGLIVEGRINGVLCGVGRTVADESGVFYKLHVAADDGNAPGCGTTGVLAQVSVQGLGEIATVLWDRNHIQQVDLGAASRIFLPNVNSQ